MAKGLVLGGAGILVIVATLQADPSKAAGFDAAVKTLGQVPFGKVLLILAALGIAAFGAYSFVRARFGACSAGVPRPVDESAAVSVQPRDVGTVQPTRVRRPRRPALR